MPLTLKRLAFVRRRHLYIATAVSTLGGLLFGYDNIVISGAIGYLSQFFHLDPAGIGWAAGCALIGCIVGAAGGGAVADRIGLKKGLAICAACFVLSSVGMLSVSSLTQFVIWRMIGGLGIGAASIMSPMYIAEIASSRPTCNALSAWNCRGHPLCCVCQYADPAHGQ